MQNYFDQRSTNSSTSGHPGWDVFYKERGNWIRNENLRCKAWKILISFVQTVAIISATTNFWICVRCNHHKNFLWVRILSPNKISLWCGHVILEIHVLQIHVLQIQSMFNKSNPVHFYNLARKRVKSQLRPFEIIAIHENQA